MEAVCSHLRDCAIAHALQGAHSEQASVLSDAIGQPSNCSRYMRAMSIAIFTSRPALQ